MTRWRVRGLNQNIEEGSLASGHLGNEIDEINKEVNKALAETFPKEGAESRGISPSTSVAAVAPFKAMAEPAKCHSGTFDPEALEAAWRTSDDQRHNETKSLLKAKNSVKKNPKK